jgi:ATP-dependent helicase/nuclease subunit A
MVSGQIDRLAIEGERVLFADYKTTASPPTSAADIAPAYLRQMALYHASLAQMFPGKEILGALVWTVTGRVDWLEPGSLLKHLPPSANSAFSAQ